MQVEQAMCSFTELSSVSTNKSTSLTSKIGSDIVGSLIDDYNFSRCRSNSSLNSTVKGLFS